MSAQDGKFMPYKWMVACPIENIPSKELFVRLNNKIAREELICRGWDVKSILRAKRKGKI